MPKPNKPSKMFAVAAVAIVAALTLSAALIVRVQRLRGDPLRAFLTPAQATPAPEAQSARAPIAQIPTRQAGPCKPTPGQKTTPQPTPAPARAPGGDTINIVLMGLDSDKEREAMGGGYRSDMIAVMVIDVKAPACTVISVPRDTRARVRKLNGAGKVTGVRYNKINASFQLGGGPERAGHENLLYALEKLFFDGLDTDMRLSYYCSLDMDSIEKFADAVGGVPVTLAYDIKNFGAAGETILLQGENARRFVRLRHGITGGGDIGRIERQKAFMLAFANRVKQMGAKEALPRLFSILAGEMRTNLNAGQVIVLADILHKLPCTAINLVTLPGKCKTIENRSYYVPDTAAIKALAIKLWGK
ncbi:MAG: LCP family protein [Clostridiales bacterium]|nr:LCP family protein [Clostridiales bacterium]